ncbi:MAG: hypothetical protein K2O03_11280, partial [Lachnospiraceae bacterium]|nr:hypothetical protein [Lachnospiraceae bacterium]
VIFVEGGIADEVHIAADALAVESLLMADWEQPSVEIRFETKLTAPVAAGEVVGSITYSIDGTEYAATRIRTLEAVAEPDFFYWLQRVIWRWKTGDLF